MVFKRPNDIFTSRRILTYPFISSIYCTGAESYKTIKLKTMKVIQQINESSYDSYNAFIKALKPITKENFKSFVPNKEPDPNEYKEINLEGVIFGDFPQKGEGIYVIKFDFQDWDNPDSLYKDMVFVLDELNQKRESGEIDMTTIVVHLVHYMD